MAFVLRYLLEYLLYGGLRLHRHGVGVVYSVDAPLNVLCFLLLMLFPYAVALSFCFCLMLFALSFVLHTLSASVVASVHSFCRSFLLQNSHHSLSACGAKRAHEPTSRNSSPHCTLLKGRAPLSAYRLNNSNNLFLLKYYQQSLLLNPLLSTASSLTLTTPNNDTPPFTLLSTETVP